MLVCVPFLKSFLHLLHVVLSGGVSGVSVDEHGVSFPAAGRVGIPFSSPLFVSSTVTTSTSSSSAAAFLVVSCATV